MIKMEIYVNHKDNSVLLRQQYEIITETQPSLLTTMVVVVIITRLPLCGKQTFMRLPC
jgi:hypothetical protein